MRSSDWLLALLLVCAPALAFDMERDDWLLPQVKPLAPEARPRYDTIAFARIKATGNDREPVYADGTQRELVAAAARNDMKGVEALLNQGVNANAVIDEWGENALMHAVSNSNVGMTRALLDAGGDRPPGGCPDCSPAAESRRGCGQEKQ